jgi:predicted permease
MLLQEIRYALRRLRREYLFSVGILATLAAGIGANVGVFSIVNAVLLRQLPFVRDERLVAIWEEDSKFGLKESAPAFGNYLDWHDHNRSCEDIGAFDGRVFQVTGAEEADEIAGGVVTPSFLTTLGVIPSQGRLFSDSEEHPGAHKVAIISYRLWRRRYAGRSTVSGLNIFLNGDRYLIIGVMPQRFRFPTNDTEVWVPTGSFYVPSEWSNRDRHNLFVVARLRDGVSLQQANADIQAITTRLQREYPETNATVSSKMQPLRAYLIGDVRSLYKILLIAAGGILLITCANLANLVLSRANQRRKEVAITIALGGGLLCVVGQHLTETSILGLFGGVLGLAIAALSGDTLKYLLPGDMVNLVPISLDYRVLTFTLIVSVLSGLLLALTPVLQATRSPVVQALRESTAVQAGSGRAARKIQTVLVVLQVAVSLMLLISSTLVLQTFVRLRTVKLGFNPSSVLTMKISLPNDYTDPRAVEFGHTTLERIKGTYGVVAAGITTGVPLALKGSQTGIRVENLAVHGFPVVNNRSITPVYFRAMGMRLMQGRNVLDSDGPQSPPVAVINEAMAQQIWSGENPIGKRFQVGMQSVWVTVVGVVGDVKQAGLNVATKPEMYLAFAQQPETSFAVAVRTNIPPVRVVPAVRQIFREADPNVPVTQIATMDEIIDKELFNRRLQTILLGVFAGIATLVAAVGTYSVIAYSVKQQTREIGIRLALGARPSDVLCGVVYRGMKLTLFGVLLGLTAALGATRYLATLLFGIGSRDLKTFIGVSFFVMVVALVAIIVPAIRASRIDPVSSLRYE